LDVLGVHKKKTAGWDDEEKRTQRSKNGILAQIMGLTSKKEKGGINQSGDTDSFLNVKVLWGVMFCVWGVSIVERVSTILDQTTKGREDGKK